MVRSLVGTIVACGTGRLRPGEVMGIMHSKSRLRANQIAPRGPVLMGGRVLSVEVEESVTLVA